MRGARTIRLLGCALSGAAAALVMAAPAGAAEEPAEAAIWAFSVPAGNGYGVAVTASTGGPFGGSGPGYVAITASRPGSAATYATKAAVTPTSIQADLGPLGRLDLKVRLSGATRKERVPCGNSTEPFETGEVEGAFVFRGEGGYTSVTATRAPLIPWFKAFIPWFGSFGPCGGGGESSGPGISGARLKGVSYSGGRILGFQINKNRPKGPTIYRASLRQRRDGISISREVHGVTASGGFRFGRSLETATLSPPAPFAGSAVARRDADAVSPLWGGNLTVDFPGLPDFPLAAPGTHVSLIHSRLHDDDGSVGISFGRWPSTKR